MPLINAIFDELLDSHVVEVFRAYNVIDAS
jgi:hypothetical protein